MVTIDDSLEEKSALGNALQIEGDSHNEVIEKQKVDNPREDPGLVVQEINHHQDEDEVRKNEISLKQQIIIIFYFLCFCSMVWRLYLMKSLR